MLVAVLLMAAITQACGSNGRDSGDTSAGATEPAADHSQSIRIETQVTLKVEDPRYNSKQGIVSGTVVGGTLGNSDFCVDGTIRDRHGSETVGGLVDRTFECPDGTLRIAFTPGFPHGLTQKGSWHVVSGTDALAGMQGGGEMKITYESKDSNKGQEVFTGTLTAS